MFQNSTPFCGKKRFMRFMRVRPEPYLGFYNKIKDEKHLPTRDLSVIILYVSMCGKG